MLPSAELEQREEGLVLGTGPLQRAFFLRDGGSVAVAKGGEPPRKLAADLRSLLLNHLPFASSSLGRVLLVEADEQRIVVDDEGELSLLRRPGRTDRRPQEAVGLA